jgi:hydroxylaminobenzene mutase
MDDRSVRINFISAGVFLILLGLLTGFIIPNTTNPRVAMSSHVEAIMGGMLLIIIGGIVWEQAHFGERTSKIVQILFFYSAYSNWFFLLLSAMLGTSKLLPIAAKGFGSTAVREQIVAGGLISSALAILAAMIALLASIRMKRDKQKHGA